MSTVWAESHTVDWLLMFSQRMDTNASLDVPKTNSGVKRCTGEQETMDKQSFRGAAVESEHVDNMPTPTLEGRKSVLLSHVYLPNKLQA